MQFPSEGKAGKRKPTVPAPRLRRPGPEKHDGTSGRPVEGDIGEHGWAGKIKAMVRARGRDAGIVRRKNRPGKMPRSFRDRSCGRAGSGAWMIPGAYEVEYSQKDAGLRPDGGSRDDPDIEPEDFNAEDTVVWETETRGLSRGKNRPAMTAGLYPSGTGERMESGPVPTSLQQPQFAPARRDWRIQRQ